MYEDVTRVRGYFRRVKKNGTHVLEDGKYIPVRGGTGTHIWVSSRYKKRGNKK